ncbi:Hypothetical predicted protein, partial [Marmota monax]
AVDKRGQGGPWGGVTELMPCETENPMGGYSKTISHVIKGLKTAKGTKKLKGSSS